MASVLSRLDSDFPNFTGRESPEEQIGMLTNYIYDLVNALRYQLSNLDSDNFNSPALDQIKLDTTKDVRDQVKDLQDLGQKLQAAVTDLQTAQATLTESVKTNAEGVKTNTASLKQVTDSLTAISEILKPDGKGGGILGTEGQTINIIGTVLINGKPAGGA